MIEIHQHSILSNKSITQLPPELIHKSKVLIRSAISKPLLLEKEKQISIVSAINDSSQISIDQDNCLGELLRRIVKF